MGAGQEGPCTRARGSLCGGIQCFMGTGDMPPSSPPVVDRMNDRQD